MLSNDELRRIVVTANDTSLEHLIAFVLHTVARSREVRSARWADFDFEKRLWTVRATETGITHVPPLSQGALRILASIPERTPFVFPTHYSIRSKAPHTGNPKARISVVCRKSGVSDWSLHDLRRTVRTRLPGIAVTPDVAERILGHTIGGTRRVYDTPRLRPAEDGRPRGLERRSPANRPSAGHDRAQTPRQRPRLRDSIAGERRRPERGAGRHRGVLEINCRGPPSQVPPAKPVA